MRLMISRFTMDSNFRAKKWCSPGALWMGERVEKGGKGAGRGKEGGRKGEGRGNKGAVEIQVRYETQPSFP